MLKKVVSIVATLGVGASIFGSNISLAETYTDNKVASSQYKTALKKYQEREEVQLANKIKQSKLKQVKSQEKTLTKAIKKMSDEEFVRFIEGDRENPHLKERYGRSPVSRWSDESVFFFLPLSCRNSLYCYILLTT